MVADAIVRRHLVLKQIDVKNFRGFETLVINPGRVTALMGPNSSGKTTALQAVQVACGLLQLALQSESRARVDEGWPGWIRLAEGLVLPRVDRVLPLADWRALFVDQRVGEGVRLDLQLLFDETDAVQELWVTIVCGRNQQLKLDVAVRSAQAGAEVRGVPKKSGQVNERLTRFFAQHAPRAVFVPPFYGTVLGEEYRARAVVDEHLGSGDQTRVVRNLVAALDPDRYERLNQFLADTLGARLVYRTHGDALQTETPLRVTFADSNGEIELSAAGTGLVNLVALYAALSRWSQGAQQRTLIYLLDEPEAHLHPRLQAESASRLARLITGEFSGQLLFATHSVDILNRLSNEGATLVRCDRTRPVSAITLTSDAELFRDLAGWCDLSPYTAINFLASRRLLFVEGRSELGLLPRLAELRYRRDSERLARFRRWAMVPLDGSKNDTLPRLLARLIQSEALQKTARAGEVKLVVVLDRDHTREPGKLFEEQGGVRTTTVVWSQHSLESLLVEPEVLTLTLRAWLGERAPADLDVRVDAAIAEVNDDAALNDAAVDQLFLALKNQALTRGDETNSLTGDSKFVYALGLARTRVRAAPQVWQQGKGRAEAILTKIREGLPKAAQSTFTTDIVALWRRLNLNNVSDPVLAIPQELRDLLELLTEA